MKKLFTAALAALTLLPLNAKAESLYIGDEWTYISEECSNVIQRFGNNLGNLQRLQDYESKLNPWTSDLKFQITFDNADVMHKVLESGMGKRAAELIINKCDDVVQVDFGVQSTDYIVTYRAIPTVNGYQVKQTECVQPGRREYTLPWTHTACL